MFFTFHCNQYLSDFGILEKVVITGPLGLFTVSRILEFNKNISLEFQM